MIPEARFPPLRQGLSVTMRYPVLTVVSSFLAIPLLFACWSVHTVAASEAPQAGPAAVGGQPAGPAGGKAVTKEVPHTSETVPGIRDRESKEPRAPRGDTAMPPHRIRPADNSAATTPCRQPAGAAE